MWIYRNVECGQTWICSVAVRLTEHTLSHSTSCPTQSVFKPYASQFILCHKASTDHQILQSAILFFRTFKPVFLLFLPYLSPSPNLVLFSPPLTLISPPPSHFCCLCQKGHILRVVIACLLASTPVAVNVVVWDGEESYALWPLWHETPLDGTFAADVKPTEK